MRTINITALLVYLSIYSNISIIDVENSYINRNIYPLIILINYFNIVTCLNL